MTLGGCIYVDIFRAIRTSLTSCTDHNIIVGEGQTEREALRKTTLNIKLLDKLLDAIRIKMRLIKFYKLNKIIQL